MDINALSIVILESSVGLVFVELVRGSAPDDLGAMRRRCDPVIFGGETHLPSKPPHTLTTEMGHAQQSLRISVITYENRYNK